MEKVSVIVPVYNVAPYLGECIESIIHQTYSNLEIILVNDGSTDSSLRICEHYRHLDSRIHVISCPNRGCGPARNAALRVAQGDFVLFVDGDDTIGPDHIQHLYDNLKQYDSDVAFSYYYRIDANNTYYFLLNDQEKGQSGFFTSRKLLNHPLWATDPRVTMRLYKRQLFNNIQFPTSIYEDVGTTWKVMFNARRISYVKLDEYCWRIRGGSVTAPREDLPQNRAAEFRGWHINYRFKEERIALQQRVGIPATVLEKLWLEDIQNSYNHQRNSPDSRLVKASNFRMQIFQKYHQG